MPIYEWLCIVCGHRFETFQSMEADRPQCPKCEGEVTKCVSDVQHRFYGKGWTKPNVKKS